MFQPTKKSTFLQLHDMEIGDRRLKKAVSVNWGFMKSKVEIKELR